MVNLKKKNKIRFIINKILRDENEKKIDQKRFKTKQTTIERIKIILT